MLKLNNKKCTQCHVTKSMDDFANKKNSKNGKQHYCKKCKNKDDNDRYYADRENILDQQKAYYHKNKERLAENRKSRLENPQKRAELNAKRRAYREKNKEKINEKIRASSPEKKKRKRESDIKYNSKNKDKIRRYFREYTKNRKKKDPLFKLKHLIRTRIYQIFKVLGISKESTETLLGCSFEHAKTYIENQFQPGMTWDNYGEWHIDHKHPLSLFDLSDREQFLKACHYTNLQHLWAIDNLKKGNKISLQEEK